MGRGDGPAGISLVDANGLGKPRAFKNDESKFVEWYRKTCACFIAVYGEQIRGHREWIEDQAQDATALTLEVVNESFGPSADEKDIVPERKEKARQLLCVALEALTEGGSFSIATNAQEGHGAEAMEEWIGRWGLSSGGKRSVLSKQVTGLQRTALANLRAELEEWKEFIMGTITNEATDATLNWTTT